MNRRPHTPLVLTDEKSAELRIEGELEPWALAGGRVWVPDGTTWAEAEPQPHLVDGYIAGPICAVRGARSHRPAERRQIGLARVPAVSCSGDTVPHSR